MRRLLPAAALLFVLGSCATPAPPPPPSRPVVIAPRPTPAPLPASADWRDWPLTPGDWTYARDGRGSIARFGQVGADAELMLRCDRNARQVYVSRRGDAAATGLTVRTSSAARALAVRPTGDGYVAVALAAGDPLLDAMGFSRGRFVVEQAGAPTLVVPAWAEVLRVTEDCRG